MYSISLEKDIIRGTLKILGSTLKKNQKKFWKMPAYKYHLFINPPPMMMHRRYWGVGIL